MSSLTISVQNKEKESQSEIAVSCEFYIQYKNGSTGRTITSNVLATLEGISGKEGEVALLSSRVANTREFTKYWERFERDNRQGMSVATSFKIIASANTTPTSKFASATEIIQFDLTGNRGKLEKSKNGYYTLPSKIVGNKAIILLSAEDETYDLAKLEINLQSPKKNCSGRWFTNKILVVLATLSERSTRGGILIFPRSFPQQRLCESS